MKKLLLALLCTGTIQLMQARFETIKELPQMQEVKNAKKDIKETFIRLAQKEGNPEVREKTQQVSEELSVNLEKLKELGSNIVSQAIPENIQEQMARVKKIKELVSTIQEKLQEFEEYLQAKSPRAAAIFSPVRQKLTEALTSLAKELVLRGTKSGLKVAGTEFADALSGADNKTVSSIASTGSSFFKKLMS